MESRIQIKTGEPEAQLLAGVGTSWTSKMHLVINGNDQYLGDIYHDKKEELNNIRSYFERMPDAFAAIQKFNMLNKEVHLRTKGVQEVHDIMSELFTNVERSL
jgi:hypothetical protein